MKYFKVIWHHIFEDEPSTFYSEIDADGYESRKIEFHKNSELIGFASINLTWGPTILSDQIIPSIEEINEDDEFDALEIYQNDFEKIWNEIRNKGLLPDLKTAENLYPTIFNLLKEYEFFVDINGDEDDIAYRNLVENLQKLTNKSMTDHNLYETWENEGIEVVSFRIALPDPKKIEGITKIDVCNILNKISNLKINDYTLEEQNFEQQFEIYLDNYYHKLLEMNFKNYNYKKLFAKQKNGTWLTNDEIINQLFS